MADPKSWLIHLEKGSWQIVPTDDEPSVFSPEKLVDQAQPIAEALRERGHHGEPVVLDLASSWCLTATVPIRSPQMLRRRGAMHHHLEDWLPWTAEDYVVDYVGHQQEAFMTAVRIEPLAEFLTALEELDVPVAVICPTVLLAASDYLSGKEVPTDLLILSQFQETVDLVTVQNGQIYGWSHLPAEADEVDRAIRSASLASTNEPTVVGLGLESALVEKLSHLGLKVATDAHDRMVAPHTSATNILGGLIEPPFNLRRDKLAGRRRIQRLAKQTYRLQAAGAILLLLVTIGLWIRADQYHQGADTAQQQLVRVYQKVFPDKEIPENVAGELDQEFRSLQATRAPSEEFPDRPDADVILEQILMALPEQLRFRLPEIHIEGERISLGAEVRNNSDADRIAAALQEQGFGVDPPRTQRLADKGFSVRLNVSAEKR